MSVAMFSLPSNTDGTNHTSSNGATSGTSFAPTASTSTPVPTGPIPLMQQKESVKPAEDFENKNQSDTPQNDKSPLLFHHIQYQLTTIFQAVAEGGINPETAKLLHSHLSSLKGQLANVQDYITQRELYIRDLENALTALKKEGGKKSDEIMASRALSLMMGKSEDNTGAATPKEKPKKTRKRKSKKSADGDEMSSEETTEPESEAAAANQNPNDPNAANTPKQKRKRGKLPDAATNLLKQWILEHRYHPYPTEEEKALMCTQTQLTLNQINNWFTNARRRFLQKQGSTASVTGTSPTTPTKASGDVATSSITGDAMSTSSSDLTKASDPSHGYSVLAAFTAANLGSVPGSSLPPSTSTVPSAALEQSHQKDPTPPASPALSAATSIVNTIMSGGTVDGDISMNVAENDEQNSGTYEAPMDTADQING